VIRRDDGQVLVFERTDIPGAWQFPQGGLDPGETPVEAAWREVAEETGLTKADLTLVAEHAEWIAYELPEERRRAKTGLGQVQKWFSFRPIHDALVPTPDQHEFSAYRWVTVDWLLGHVAEFRQSAYERGLRGLLDG
jgi:putative (di)nucleoside polyphosphate hydrolase